ncbi:hypothetical protein GGX14DRAFT_556053 [Mycena pura]|uniref:Uncharacterized protein n=1 Tax=Mycena pura TaxID=153505 RepID=A0AAD7E495_9AGAR|nr:hypothetical protein GGX14DRAFT_556053 [Mycena pura]
MTSQFRATSTTEPAQGPSLPPIAARYQQDLHLRVEAASTHNLPPPSKRRKVTAVRKPSDRLRDAARFFLLSDFCSPVVKPEIAETTSADNIGAMSVLPDCD